ncbi:MAG TPA: FtsX-like permease family protein [Steroidobacteraceae bacterium]|nr:FtsX-like permease family protein [Steroidobacteraceae bacterium]
MKYWPLIRSALLRRPAEAVLILLAVTTGFALFGFMIALAATETRVVDAVRADRLYVNARFETRYGLPIALEEQIRSIDGVTGVGAFRWLNGRYNDSRHGLGVNTVDEGMRISMAEARISQAQWSGLFAAGTGVLITKRAAANLGLRRGDVFHLSTGARQVRDVRDDGNTSWAFQVVEVLPDLPDWGEGGLILGNYRYTENARSRASRGYVDGFRVAVQDPKRAASIARQIDHRYANSGTPTLSIPARAAAEAMVRTGVSLASMTWGIGTTGLFMIVFLTGNSIAQSVRRRIPEFATLKAMGYTDSGVMWLVWVEAAIPCCVGAIVGTGFAALFAAVPQRYIPQALASVPHATVTMATLEWALALALLIAFAGSVMPVLLLRRLDVAAAINGRVR